MSILEDFYLDKIRPFDRKADPRSKYHQYFSDFKDFCLQLKEFLPENKQQLLRQMLDCGFDLSYESGKDSYISGFITGMRFAAECFCEKD